MPEAEAAKPDHGEEISRSERSLKCELLPEERHEYQDDLVEWTQKRAERETALEAWKAKKKDEQKLYEAEIMSAAANLLRLAETLDRDWEIRDVECADYIKGSTVTTVRLDTFEVVAERPAREDELQRSLLTGEILPEIEIVDPPSAAEPPEPGSEG